MKPRTARFILTKFYKFKIADPDLPPESKHIVLGAPHSSISDFIVAWLYYRSIGGFPRVMIKQELFFWPLGMLLRNLGAIPVDRRNPVRVTKQVIDAMSASGTFHLCIAPEGTRKPVKRWKTGFHTFARAAGVPVYLGYFDWSRKIIGHGPRFECTDDAMADLRAIQSFYREKDVRPKHKGCLAYLDE